MGQWKFLLIQQNIFLGVAPMDACQSPTISSQEVRSSDIVFPIMQHSECDSPLADMWCLFSNASMIKWSNHKIKTWDCQYWYFNSGVINTEKYL